MLLSVVAMLMPASAAFGASRVIVRGAGFGHGVGMSQYGAYGFAKHGRDYRFILAHYYSGTQIGKLTGAGETRVLLRSAGRATFSGVIGVFGGRRLDPAQTYVASRALGGAIVLRSAGGRDLGTYEAPLRVTGASAGFVLRGGAANGVTDGRYRGSLEVRPGSLGVSAINAVDLEDYVRGVVAGEVPASWPADALRAQAVAARTYAIATSKHGDGFDQYADTRSQMYVGVAGEAASTNAAVAATAGEVVAYEGQAIVAYYFSTSGGRTEDVENSFIGAEPVPYLKSVADPYDTASPRHRWTVRMTLGKASARLGGLVKGYLRQIRVLSRGSSPRVVRAQIVGTRGRTNVTGPQLRSKLGLYDTWARFTVITASAVRGDGNTPSAGGGGGEPGTGGAEPRAARGGGRFAAPTIAAAREAAGAPAVGAVAGRVAPAIAGRWVTLERYAGRAWVAQFETLTERGGRYRASVVSPGLYRVRYEGEPGPAVRVTRRPG
jgi:stage II sporulation protein D